MKHAFSALVGASVVAALALAGTALATAGKVDVSSPSKGTKIHVVELFTHAGSVDVAPAGPSQGDYLVWDDALVTPGTKHVVGHVSGTCFLVNVAAGLYDCPGVTFALAKGQILAQGLLPLAAKGPTFGTIIGGTGAYASAHGQDRGRALGPTALDWVLTVKA